MPNVTNQKLNRDVARTFIISRLRIMVMLLLKGGVGRDRGLGYPGFEKSRPIYLLSTTHSYEQGPKHRSLSSILGTRQ
jgi:hypothetical protein